MTALFHQPIICPILIDRKNEIDVLRTLIDQAKAGRGQVVLLYGEAGVGKSRLVTEIKAYAALYDFLLLQGSCFPTDHAIPYAPLLDLLRSFLISQSTTFSAVEVKQLFQAYLPLLPDIEHLLPDISPLSPLTPLDPEPEKRRFVTLAHFLNSQARESPVLLVVEDLHWSDETSLELLYYVVRRCCSGNPLLILLTYRNDELSSSLRHFLAQLDRERLAQEVPIDRLRRDGVEAMLRAIFALPNTTRLELLDPIYTLTGGNPFFIEEILTSLIASGEIYYANGRWERKPPGDMHIPRSVQDAVHQRTDQLSKPTREIMIIAAVAGRRFDFALLQELSNHDEQHLLRVIKELIAAQVVVEESEEQFALLAVTTLSSIGDRLGLFKNLAEQGPATSGELAERANINERYAREWLSAMACAGYLEYDPVMRRFTLPIEYVPVLAQEGGSVFFGGVQEEMVGLVGPVNQLMQAFRSGGGVPMEAYDPSTWEGVTRFTSGWFENLLVPVWLPEMPEVQAKLERGALIADVGCGQGKALIKLTQTYPQSRYVGYDNFAPSIEKAKANAEALGVADCVHFEHRDVSTGLPEQYDVITTFDVVHDAVNPRRLLQSIRNGLRPDGRYVCLEINSSDKLEENLGLLGAFFYSCSVLYCMTTSLAHHGEGLGTTGVPESKLREVCAEAGFGHVRRVPMENPFNILYEITL